MRHAILTGVLFVLGVASAHASDLTPLPPPVSGSLSGCYAGAFVGGSYTRETTGITSVMSITEGDAAIGGGPVIGCDVQLGVLIAGVWGDYTFQSSKVTNQILGVQMVNPIGDEWAIGGKLGVYTSSAKTTDIYAKLGYAEGTGEKAMIATLPVKVGSPSGFVAGGGIEHFVTRNVALFGEYRHEAFDTRNGTLGGIIPTKFDTARDRVMAGVTVHF